MLSGMAIGFTGGALVGAIIGGAGAYLNYGSVASLVEKLGVTAFLI